MNHMIGKKAKEIGKRIKKDASEYKYPILLFLLYYISVKAVFHAYCPMVLITGLPCPGCGMTRAILLLLSGEWQRSWNLQPFAILWVLFGIWIVVWRYILGKRIKWFNPILIVLLVSLIAFYIYRMVTAFPSYPPMTYRYDNLFSNMFYFYHDLLRMIWKV